MSKMNHDNNIGLAGFEVHSDEFAVNAPEHDDSTEASQKTSSESAGNTDSTIYEAPAKRTKSGGIWWVIIIGVLGVLWLWGESDNKPRSSSYSSSSPSAALAPQPTAPEPKLADPGPEGKEELNIELATGLSLRKVDKNGQVIREKGGYDDGQKFILQYRGRTIAKDDTAAYGKLANHWKIVGADVVQVETSSGGNGCESEQRLVVVSSGRVILSKEFGNCSPPKITSAPDQVTFTFFVSYGERLVATYKDSKLTQANVKLSTKYNPASNQPGYAYLAKEKEIESILLDDKLNGTLTQLMGNDFQTLKDRLIVSSGVTVENGYLVISGGMPHSFGTNEGYLAIGLNEPVVYAAVLEGEYLDQLKKFIYHLRAYSTESASVPPSSMNKWMAQFKETTPTWKYEK